MDAEIVAIGTELVLGATVDTNSAWIARELAPVGVLIRRITVVDDERPAIAEALRGALGRSELVICSGGLGPTADDLTREAVADAFGRELEFRPDLMEQIEARFRAFGRTMSESNRRQAYIPAGSRPIPNPHGTAPSFLVEQGDRALIALPGVPSELRFLVQQALVPYLRDERQLCSYLLVKTLRLSGLSESTAGELIADLMEASNPRVGITAKGGQYEVRIAAHGSSADDAAALLEPVEQQLRERLAAYLLAGGRLQDHVLALLRSQGKRLALYEGQQETPVYRALSLAEESLAPIAGVQVHPPETPLDDDAAQQLALQAARAVREHWGSDLALAVQQAQRDEQGFAEIAFALVTAEGEETLRRRFDLTLQEGWEIAASAGLELLRRLLERQ